MRVSPAAVCFGLTACCFGLLTLSFGGTLATAAVLGQGWTFASAFIHAWISAALLGLFAWLSGEAAASSRTEASRIPENGGKIG